MVEGKQILSEIDDALMGIPDLVIADALRHGTKIVTGGKDGLPIWRDAAEVAAEWQAIKAARVKNTPSQIEG